MAKSLANAQPSLADHPKRREAKGGRRRAHYCCKLNGFGGDPGGGSPALEGRRHTRNGKCLYLVVSGVAFLNDLLLIGIIGEKECLLLVLGKTIFPVWSQVYFAVPICHWIAYPGTTL